MSEVLNKFSRKITQAKVQGASQAMLYATGLTEEDMDKPQIGIGSVWYEGNSCNMHLDKIGCRSQTRRDRRGIGRHAVQYHWGQ